VLRLDTNIWRTLLPPSAGWRAEDGGSRILWNAGILLQHYKVSQSRWPQHESSLPWILQISQRTLKLASKVTITFRIGTPCSFDVKERVGRWDEPFQWCSVWLHLRCSFISRYSSIVTDHTVLLSTRSDNICGITSNMTCLLKWINLSLLFSSTFH
jgi:hypothetical protein